MTDKTVRVLLTADAKRLLDALNRAGVKLEEVGAEGARSGQKAAAGLNQTEREAGRLSNRLQGLGRIAASAFGAFTAAQIVKSVGAGLYGVRKEFEQLNAQLITVEQSESRARVAFQRIQQFAAETPYQLQEVVQAFIKLRARGLDPSADALRAYGNFASGMSKSLDQVIEAVGDAATGEFERLKEFGVVARQTGDEVTFTFRGMSTTVKKNAGEIEQYLQRIGLVDFSGSMTRQMENLSGVSSNLGDAMSKLSLKIDSKTGFTGAIKAAMRELTAWVNQMAGVSRPVASIEADIAAMDAKIAAAARRPGRGVSAKALSGQRADLVDELLTTLLGSTDTAQIERGVADLRDRIAAQLERVSAARAADGGRLAIGSGRNRGLSDYGRAQRELTALQTELASAERRIAELRAADVQPDSEAGANGTPADRVKRLQATLDAESAIKDAQAARETADLDEQLRRHAISYQQYYQRRGELDTAAVQRQIQARQQLLGQLGSGADDAAERIKLQGEINALKVREQTIGQQTQAQIAQAADEADKRLADVRQRLAKLQGDATALAAETRSQLEREYADILADPGTSDTDRAKIESLIDREALQAEFDAVQAQADDLIAGLRQQWDSLSQSVQAGTMNTAEAQAAFNDALATTNPDLQAFLQRLATLAQDLGPEARREIQGLTQQLGSLADNTRTPLERLAADWTDTAGQLQNAGVSAMNAISDSLTDAVMTGKLDFASLARSIIADLVRVMIQAQLTSAALKLGQTIGLITSVAGAAGGAAAGGAGGVNTFGLESGGTYTPSGPFTFAGGGLLRGPGTGTSDSILMRGSNGEFVLRAESVRSIGVAALDLLNKYGAAGLDAILGSAAAPAYATGGVIGSVSPAMTRSRARNDSGNLSIEIPIQIDAAGNQTADQRQVDRLSKALKTEVESTVRRVITKEMGPRGALAG